MTLSPTPRPEITDDQVRRAAETYAAVFAATSRGEIPYSREEAYGFVLPAMRAALQQFAGVHDA